MNMDHRKVSLKFDGLGARVDGDTALNWSCGEVGENKPFALLWTTSACGRQRPPKH